MKISSAIAPASLVWAPAAFAVLSLCDAMVKYLTSFYSVAQTSIMVSVVGLGFTVAHAFIQKRPKALWPQHPKIAVLRAVFLGIDTVLIYIAFDLLPLAEAYVLAFLTPILVAFFSAILFKDMLTRKQSFAVMLGFVGVIIVLRPGISLIGWGHVAALGSAFVFAASMLVMRNLKASETDLALVSTVLIGLICCAGLLLPFSEVRPLTTDFMLPLLAAGFCFYCGHSLLVRALRSRAANLVAPFQYSQIIWGVIYGALLFAAPIEPIVLLGAAIIICAGILTWQRY